MNYNLTDAEIVASFSGAMSGDFAVAPLTGLEVINQEIEFQTAKLEMAFSNTLTNLLHEVNYEVANISGGMYFTPGLYAVPETMKVWEDNGCFPPTEEHSYTSHGGNLYSVNSSCGGDTIIISYLVDADMLSIPSLKSILRDMVCANLGNRLFASVEGGKWSIVEHYEQQAQSWLSLIKNGWLPPELKSLKRRNAGAIRVIRVDRG